MFKLIFPFFALFYLFTCSNKKSDSNDEFLILYTLLTSKTANTANDDLKRPQVNQAIILYSGTTLTLTRGNLDCVHGNLGMGFERNSSTTGEPRTLFIHNLPSTQSVGSITFSRTNGIFQVDIDRQGGGVFNVSAGGSCNAKLIQNDTHIDIQGKDCDFTPQGGGSNTKISFRAYCMR